jgi:hypothetical protein
MSKILKQNVTKSKLQIIWDNKENEHRFEFELNDKVLVACYPTNKVIIYLNFFYSF